MAFLYHSDKTFFSYVNLVVELRAARCLLMTCEPENKWAPLGL